MFVRVQVSTILLNDRLNTQNDLEILKKNGTTDTTKYIGKIKNVLFAEQEKRCDSAVTDKVYNFHAVND